MTLADLERKSAALERLRRDWAVAIFGPVRAKVEDARAHAERSITQTLKAAVEGRPSARQAIRSPSYQAALNRLDELWTWLAGPSTTSLDGRIRDAREAFYRRAFELNRPLVPAALHVTADPEPTLANLRLMRGVLIHGLDLRQELEGPFADARRRLLAAVNLAGRRSTPDHVETEILDAWYRKTWESVQAAVLRCLSDSVEFADVEAARDLVHPDYLEAD